MTAITGFQKQVGRDPNGMRDNLSAAMQIFDAHENSGLGVLNQPWPMDTLVDRTTAPGVVYVGSAAIGASKAEPVWQIMRVDSAGGDVAVGYAIDMTKQGKKNFAGPWFVWNDRAALTYSQ